MKVVLEIPEEVAENLSCSSENLERAALEALAVEGYRSGVLTTKLVRLLLKQSSRFETEDFLAAHGVWPGTTSEEIGEDSRALSEILAR